MNDALAGQSGDALAAIAALWDQFKDVNMQRLAVVDEAAIAQLAGQLDPELRRKAEREAHKLAGSVGTFGFAQGSILAREIELLLAGETPLGQAQTLRLSELAVSLRRELEMPPVQNDASVEQVNEGNVLLVVDSDRDRSERIIAEAAARGFRAVSAQSAHDAREAMRVHTPHAVLLDLAISETADDALSLLSELQNRQPPIPVIVSTARDTFVDRVRVASLGGRGFLPKTLPPMEVLDTVERVMQAARGNESRILAVDDDPLILGALRTVLGRQGLQVTTLGTPTEFWETLDQANPDLLILDIDMPDITGIDLCRVVRNDPRWSSLPILFLTGRSDAGTIQEVFAAGADDFVTKPVVGPELVARIRNRIERVQLLRRVAETDSLTGVPNRKVSSQTLVRFTGLAERQGLPFSLAILDLDHLKTINDSAGHAAGDTVLQQFALSLQQRFRGEDIIGRWGGEEFVVGMYGMNQSDAIQRLTTLREEIARNGFRGPDGERISLTFTAGVAEYPGDGRDLSALYRAADGALTAAKGQGGNVVLGTSTSREEGPRAASTDVVIVDDDEVLGGILMHSLQTRGYRTQWLRDGETAALTLAGSPPTVRARVIILDVDLPGLSGLALLQRLAAAGITARSRVIMVTARSQEAEVLKALDLGAFDHVAKPFSLPVLMQRVRKALEVD